MVGEILDDLEAEQALIEEILAGLSPADWLVTSDAPPWTVADVVLHLAQTEEAVVITVTGDTGLRDWRAAASNLDEAMDLMVRAERAAPEAIFERWRVARRAALTALRGADPGRAVDWAAAPLKPRTLATTRLAEHWAHALDITGPLAIAYPDTDRLRHIAWLGHHTLPYALALAGTRSGPVHAALTAPDGGSTWRFGPDDAESRITGPAAAFCRVGARRLLPEDSGLVATDPHAKAALHALRNYAA
jgi:uncharacterized protein (TIGR03084 family)